MPSIQLFLTFSSQTIRCDSAIPHRSLTFLGRLKGEAELSVTRDGRDFDSRQSPWKVTVLDIKEYPLTEFYAERAAARNIDWLAGAIYLTPSEYAEAAQPEITVYVWLPNTAFDSVWNVSPNLQTFSLQTVLNLTVPFQGSALDYLPRGPDNYDLLCNAAMENPLLLESAEFYIAPITQSNSNDE